MANSSDESSVLQSPRDFHCKVCNLYLDTADSLKVHLQYHKENLYFKGGAQNRENASEHNGLKVKAIETTVSAPADSSGSMIANGNTEYQQRGTPETSMQFQNPTTPPQSYHSAPSPYQNHDQTNFSRGAQFGKYYNHPGFAHDQHTNQINWEQLQFNQDYRKSSRFQPYNKQERGPQVSSSSSLYGQGQSQPMTSPSSNQCDKCGFVCDSAAQLDEHCNSAHGGGGASPVSNLMHYQQFPGNQYGNSTYVNESTEMKDKHEDSSPSDILDLDSQKVLYQDTDSQQSGGEVNIRAGSMMQWEPQRPYSNFQINGNATKDPNAVIDSKQKLQAGQKIIHIQGRLPEHLDQKLFMHGEQEIYQGLQMPQTNNNNPGFMSKPDMKPRYRPYDPPAVPQITSTQPASCTSSNLPPLDGKGANWKSNEARRPKNYNCTACNKWFTSSGHLKRHYNTTLHKNAVRSSGQPDPATTPISNHHHPARQQKPADSTTQSPSRSDDSRNVDEASLQSYPPQNPDSSRATTVQTQPSYAHRYQGDNHPNGEAGPSVSQNHHTRGLLSATTSNISTPPLPQTVPGFTNTLPPFNHLGINPYSPGSAGPLVTTVPNLIHAPLYLAQNFQETIPTSYPNGMAPHVMDMAINSLPMGSQAIFGESTLEEVEVIEQETLHEPAGGRLPSFAQLQTPGFNVYVSNYITEPNVGGQIICNENTGGYVIVDPIHPVHYNNNEINEQSIECDYTYSPQDSKDRIQNYSPEPVKVYPYGFAVGGTTIKHETDILQNNSGPIQNLKIEDIMDYTNKENYGVQITSPSSPESARVENDNCGSPAVTSTVSTPLSEKNQGKKSASVAVHKCYECDKVFNKACYLTQHNKTFHSGEKPFKCDRCGKRFADDVSYEGHCQKHSDNKPFKCSQCPKSFNHKTDLRRHMCLHSGSKPFACDHCGKGFIRKDHMVKHYEIHIRKGGSRARVD